MTSSTVNASDTIAAILARRPDAAGIFLERRMHCAGCAMAPFETLAEACGTYRVDTDALLRALNRPTRNRRGASKRSR